MIHLHKNYSESISFSHFSFVVNRGSDNVFVSFELGKKINSIHYTVLWFLREKKSRLFFFLIVFTPGKKWN